jgi:hypothetical protein
MIISFSCILDCIDKEVGMPRVSQNLIESKKKNVFQFEMTCNKTHLKLKNDEVFKINNSWVENCWVYECINKKAVVKKKDKLQLIIDKDKNLYKDILDYVLYPENKGSGCFIDSQLSFDYFPTDTLSLYLCDYNTKDTLEVLKFWRKK